MKNITFSLAFSNDEGEITEKQTLKVNNLIFEKVKMKVIKCRILFAYQEDIRVGITQWS